MAKILGFYILFYCMSAPLLANAEDCTIFFDNGESPVFVKNFVTRSIRFIPHRNSLTLTNKETLLVYCSGNIEAYCQGNKIPLPEESIQVKCDNNGYFMYRESSSHSYGRKWNHFLNYDPRSTCSLACDKGGFGFYASSRSMPNCKVDMSYGIGIKIPTLKDSIIAGLCYDLEARSLTYVKYVIYESLNSWVVYEKNGPKHIEVDLNERVGDLNSLLDYTSSKDVEELTNTLKDNNEVLKAIEFDYVSLIQDVPLHEAFKHFDYLFNILWWRNFRLGNWKFYLNALKMRSITTKYIAHTGTSGSMTIPTRLCDQREFLSTYFKDVTVKAPELVWSYLKSLEVNSTEEFVVIGINTPFYQNNNGTRLCEDICGDIDWLKNTLFGRQRLNPVLGLVICCRPDQVKHKLDGFPTEFIKTNVEDLPPVEVDTNTPDSTEMEVKFFEA